MASKTQEQLHEELKEVVREFLLDIEVTGGERWLDNEEGIGVRAILYKPNTLEGVKIVELGCTTFDDFYLKLRQLDLWEENAENSKADNQAERKRL